MSRVSDQQPRLPRPLLRRRAGVSPMPKAVGQRGVTPTSTYTFGLNMVGISSSFISSPVALRVAALCDPLQRWAPQTAEVPRLIPLDPIGPRGRES
jgi:hypothetical protein